MEKSVFLSRELLLQKDVLKRKKVELSRGFVFVREMSGKEKELLERSMMKRVEAPDGTVSFETTLENYKTKLVVLTLCDEEGKLLFDLRDIAKVNEALSASNLEKLSKEAQEINGITDELQEELLGNLKADQEDNSSSDSASH